MTRPPAKPPARPPATPAPADASAGPPVGHTADPTGPQPSRRPGRPRRADAPAGARVVDRALDALAALAEAEGLTLSQLAARLGLPVSTMHRLLVPLAARRLAEADPGTGLWTVGPGAFRLGAAFLRRGGLADRAQPHLRALAAASGETAALAVPDGDGALVVAQVESPAALRVCLPPGTRLALHASAAGKALIAHLPLERARDLLGRGPLPALTARTMTDQGELTADLATLRHRGVLTDLGESAEGQAALAAPVFSGIGDPVAALTLAGPAARLDLARIDALAPLLARAARTLGTALGGPA